MTNITIDKKAKYAMDILSSMEVLTTDDAIDENRDYSETIDFMRGCNLITKRKERCLRGLNEEDPCECYNECRHILEEKLVYLMVI